MSISITKTGLKLALLDGIKAEEERTQELLAGSEYGPYTPANLSEAMGEFDVTGIEALCKLLTAGNTAGAGLALKTLVFDYWERSARQEAVRTGTFSKPTTTLL